MDVIGAAARTRTALRWAIQTGTGPGGFDGRLRLALRRIVRTGARFLCATFDLILTPTVRGLFAGPWRCGSGLMGETSGLIAGGRAEEETGMALGRGLIDRGTLPMSWPVVPDGTLAVLALSDDPGRYADPRLLPGIRHSPQSAGAPVPAERIAGSAGACTLHERWRTQGRPRCWSSRPGSRRRAADRYQDGQRSSSGLIQPGDAVPPRIRNRTVGADGEVVLPPARKHPGDLAT
jgi:hypothetical protein